MEEKDKHFVLVHGACHGAWCWYKVENMLRLAGHRVSALDMATSGIDPKQVEQLPSISDYLEPLIKFMESLPIQERVILVGHSFGGYGISKSMEYFAEKISVAVFISAIMPDPNGTSTVVQKPSRRFGPHMDNQFTYDNGRENPATTFKFGPEYMSANVYQLCSPEDITLARRLVRPMRLYSAEDISKEIAVSSEKYGSVSRVYLMCDEDMVIDKDFELWMIKNNPCNEVKVVGGSDHMAMLSRPNEVCASLLEVAQTYS